VEVPGVEGEPGADGASGVSAYSLVTQNFVVPAKGSTVTVLMRNSTWLAIGALVFIPGAGTFAVTALPGTASATLEYQNFAANTNAGATINATTPIVAGGAEGPEGPTGPAGSSITLTQVSVYKTGLSDGITDSAAALTDVNITLATAGKYLLLASARLDYDGATFSANQLLTVRLRETFNGPAYIANTQRNVATSDLTTYDGNAFAGALPQVVYDAAAGDVIAMYAVLSANPAAGDVLAVEGSILAIKLF